ACGERAARSGWCRWGKKRRPPSPLTWKFGTCSLVAPVRRGCFPHGVPKAILRGGGWARSSAISRSRRGSRRNGCRRMFCDIRSRPICSSTAPTSGACSRCWGMRTSPPRRSTRTCCRSGCGGSWKRAIRWPTGRTYRSPDGDTRANARQATGAPASRRRSLVPDRRMVTPLQFEKPVPELEAKIEELRHLGSSDDLNIADEVAELQAKADKQLRQIYARLTPWQKVQVARHP